MCACAASGAAVRTLWTSTSMQNSAKYESHALGAESVLKLIVYECRHGF